MIWGMGTDLLDISRIAMTYHRFGRRFARRILSQKELEHFASSQQPVRFLAKRFAVKEAFAKAAGTGFRAPVTFKDISVQHDALGKPNVQTHSHLQNWLAQLGVTAIHTSLSDSKELVTATVILERQ